jgi:1,4-dihydroxy-2-naphthoate octaprenyltransferase
MQIKLWIRAMRAPFFQAVIIPAFLGTAVAWYNTGIFHPWYFFLTVLGVVCINAGTNLTNDYFDHKSQADDINREVTPFSGGSRVIQEGLISANRIYLAALMFFGLAIVIGLYLSYVRGWVILIIGIIGVLSGYFYTASPIRIGYHGLGELLTGFNCGPLVVLGAYYVQAQAVSMAALLASIPTGLLIAALLYINQFPDYNSDKAAGKRHLIVKLGPKKALNGFYLLVISAYVIIILGRIFGIIPWICLISLLTFPLAYKAIKTARFNYADTKRLIPAMASTIAVHLMTGLLLSLGYVIAGIFSKG